MAPEHRFVYDIVTGLEQQKDQDLAMTIHVSKIAVAKKIGVEDNIIIPVDNIILVEELERENKEKDDLLDAKDAIIDDQARTIAELKKRLGMD